MRIRYLRRAARDLVSIVAYVRRDSPNASARVEKDIVSFIEFLADFPDIGRATEFEGVLRSAMPRLPYQVYYRRAPEELRVFHIRHAHRRPLTLL